MLFSPGPRKRHYESKLSPKNSSRYFGFLEAHMCNSSRIAKVRVTDFCQVLNLLFPLCINQWSSTVPPPRFQVTQMWIRIWMTQIQSSLNSWLLVNAYLTDCLLSNVDCQFLSGSRFLRICIIGESVFASSVIAFFLWYTFEDNFSGSGLCFLMTCTKNVTQEYDRTRWDHW